MVTAYQLYYDDRTRRLLDPMAIPIYTVGVTTPLFESYWMNILPIPEKGYMGVLSPEFARKANMTVTAAIKKSNDPGIDIYSAFTIIHSLNTWHQGERYHPGFLNIARKVLTDAGLGHIVDAKTALIYSNYFFMKVEHWHEFRHEWLRPVIESLRKNSSVSTLPCRYQTSTPHSPAMIVEATGYPYYTYQPFICERLIGSFVNAKRLTHKLWVRP